MIQLSHDPDILDKIEKKIYGLIHCFYKQIIDLTINVKWINGLTLIHMLITVLLADLQIA